MNINKIAKNTPIFIKILALVCMLAASIPQPTNADFVIPCVGGSSNKIAKTVKVIITAYSSTPDQTDSTPFVTASGKTVADGIVANNMLPFGTKIRIPKLYGDKIFTIQDRMAKRKGDYHIDIWMPDRATAVKFGVKLAEIEVLES